MLCEICHAHMVADESEQEAEARAFAWDVAVQGAA